jgi:catechol 2,3-dioxygenase-like lactoylglutathione lyase family enzyme
MQSAVEFPTDTRVHIALEVSNLERSIAFYRTLFGQEPTKLRRDYAKFEVVEPPLNLSLNAAATVRPTTSHFGVQVKSSEAVQAMSERLSKAGLPTEIEQNVSCCYAVQDKVWTRDPDGRPWEVFVVVDNENAQDPDSSCCNRQPDLVGLSPCV